MANVYTKTSHYPRTTTLLDFRNRHYIKPKHRTLSPTRRNNPHQGEITLHQLPNQKPDKMYPIWMDSNKNVTNFKEMLEHIRDVNFSCRYPEKFDLTMKRKVPVIKYDESTNYRTSYANPSRFPQLASTVPTTRFGCSVDRKAARGIVPIVNATPYLPVIYKF